MLVINYVPQNASRFARMCHNPKVWKYIYCKHRVRKIQNILIVGDSGNRLTWRIWIKRKNNVERMCLLGWGATASLKLRRFDIFLTLVKLQSMYSWNVFANLSYQCYSVSEATMPGSPEMPERQKCSQIFHGKPDSNLFRVFSVYMFVAQRFQK